MSSGLELEADGELNLPFTEEGAVGAGGQAERSIGGQAWCGHAGAVSRRTLKIVSRGVHAGNLGAIEEVEGFSQHFDLSLFTNAETT